MDIVIKIGIVLAFAFFLQIIFSMLQIKHFTKQFVALRKKGKVAVGRKAGGFFAGAIVMFLIDDNGIILQGKKMEGFTALAKVKDFEGYEGRFVGDLTDEGKLDHHKNLKKAIVDAANNYNLVSAGKTVPPKPSPYKKAGNFLAKVFSGKKANQEYKKSQNSDSIDKINKTANAKDNQNAENCVEPADSNIVNDKEKDLEKE